MSGARKRAETGAATVLAVAMLGVVVVVTVATAGVVSVVAGHRRAQSGADLAALSAATALQDGNDACARARALARHNGVELLECRVQGWNVTVAVVETVRLPTHRMRLEARGRAGPVLSAPAP